MTGYETSNKNEILKQIQNEQLKVLKDFDYICQNHNVKYFLYWGSLIGAVRHKGFIPWDDDLDIGMMRDDYEKLCSLNKSIWDNSNCELVVPADKTEIHDKIFARLYVRDSKIQSLRDIRGWKRRSDSEPFYTKLPCDIYVFDYAPNNDILYLLKQKRLMTISKLYQSTKCIALTDIQSGLKARIIVHIKNTYGSIMNRLCPKPWEHLSQKYDRIAKQKHATNRICCYCDGGESTLACVDDYFPLQKMEFEDMEVYVPHNYDKVLRSYYGDYMQYPKEEDRYHIPFCYLLLSNNREYIIEKIPHSLGDKKDI